ncbi:ATP-NAD kinase-like domain-containing protein [Syncephalis fuscata]|nr:ATP-NAD kinase-like domain-containing protein [Syncephalis fuscata]
MLKLNRAAVTINNEDAGPPRVEVKMTHLMASAIQFISFDQLTPSLIEQAFKQAFDLSVLKHYQLQWRDEEKDWIYLTDSPEMIGVLQRTARQLSYRLQVQSRHYVKTDICMGPVKQDTSVHDLIHTYMRVQDLYRAVSNVKVRLGKIKHLMVVTKPGDPHLIPLTRELTIWLLDTHGELVVHINEDLKEEMRFKAAELKARYGNRIHYWQHDIAERVQVDLLVTMGGDGTVLYAANLFQHQVPLIVPFHLGSLGFLTLFEFDNYQRYLTPLMTDGTVLHNVTNGHIEEEDQERRLRMLAMQDPSLSACECLSATYGRGVNRDNDNYTRYITDVNQHKDIGANYPPPSGMTPPIITLGKMKRDLVNLRRSSEPLNACPGEKVAEYQVLNEVVMDRGANAGMIQVDLLADDVPFTTILADGLVIATATGSTAYSLSANGSLVHPEKNSMLVTPICPHTLTCRPMIIPGTKRLRIAVSQNSRSSAWASFDGRNRIALNRGDSIVITASQHPVITVSRENQSIDWFNSLREVLNWNERKTQKPLLSPYFPAEHMQ